MLRRGGRDDFDDNMGRHLARARATGTSSLLVGLKFLGFPSAIRSSPDLLVACCDVLALQYTDNVDPFVRPLARPYISAELAAEWQQLHRMDSVTDDDTTAKNLGEICATHAAFGRTEIEDVANARTKIMRILHQRVPRIKDFIGNLNQIWVEIKRTPVLDTVSVDEMRKVANLAQDDTRPYPRVRYLFFYYGLHAIDRRLIAPTDVQVVFEALATIPPVPLTIPPIAIADTPNLQGPQNFDQLWTQSTDDSVLAYVEATIFAHKVHYSNTILSAAFVQLLHLVKGSNVTANWIDRQIKLIHQGYFRAFDPKDMISQSVILRYDKLFPLQNMAAQDLYKCLITICAAVGATRPSPLWIIERAVYHNLESLACIAEFFEKATLITPSYLVHLGVPENEFVTSLKAAAILMKERCRSLFDLPYNTGDYPDLAYICKEVKNIEEGVDQNLPLGFRAQQGGAWSRYQRRPNARARLSQTQLNAIVAGIVNTMREIKLAGAERQSEVEEAPLETRENWPPEVRAMPPGTVQMHLSELPALIEECIPPKDKAYRKLMADFHFNCIQTPLVTITANGLSMPGVHVLTEQQTEWLTLWGITQADISTSAPDVTPEHHANIKREQDSHIIRPVWVDPLLHRPAEEGIPENQNQGGRLE